MAPEGCLGRPVEAFGALLRRRALHEVRASATPLAGPFPGSPDRGRVSADQLQGMTDAAARVHCGARERGGVAAGDTGAAAGDAGGRVTQQRIA